MQMSPAMRESAMVPDLYRIQHVRRETKDTFTVELRAVQRNGGVHFAPGQFNMLYVYGVGEVPISISGDPGKDQCLIHTTRAVGTVTRAMQKLHKGATLGVRGPYGTHWPVKEAEGSDIVIIAGGIGLAPLRSALYRILEHREKYGKVQLLYGARTPADILYKNELEHWRARLDMDVVVTVDRAPGTWRGNVGVVPAFIPKAAFDPSSTVSMICGPEMMMRYSVQELQKCGVADENIYVSLERNMKCGIGLCGHCQIQNLFVCKDGPVVSYQNVKDLMTKREV